jgi:hypothetical protein
MKQFLLAALGVSMLAKGFAQTYTPQAGNAISLSGSASTRFESAAGAASMQPASAISIEAWVNASCCQGAENAVLAYGNGTDDSYVLSIGANGPRLMLKSGGSTYVDIRRSVKSEQLNTARDYHVAITWSNATQTAVIYINGFKYYEQSGIPAFSIQYAAANHLTLGAKTDLTQAFNGKIDDVRIWNTALTQAAIRSRMNTLLTGTEAGLVAYYRFDEASTSTIAAATGAGVTLTGAGISSANRIASTANIPSKVPYYTSVIQGTKWDVQRTLAPGVTWRYKLYDTLFDNRQSINVLDIDLALADLDLKIANLPQNTNASLAKMKTSELLRKYGAIAAINGSYFNTSSPYGAATFLREGGSTTATTNVAHGVGYPDEKALVFNASNAGTAVIDRPAANQTTPSFVSGWSGFAGFENVLAGGPGLLTGGNVTYEYVPMDVSHEGASGSSTWRWHMSPYPFTAAGLTASNHLILTVGDGRTAAVGGAAGLTVEQVAYFMKALGCTDAYKLDGGGSSAMAVEGANENDVVNYPSDNGAFDHEGERTVPNALLLVPRVKRGSGSALAFDGNDDRVVVPHSAVGNPTGDFSVEGWARIDNGTVDDAIVSKHDNASGRKGYYVQYSYGVNRITAGIGRSNNSWGSITAATPAWTSGQWHHFALTYSITSDSLKLFVDGAFAGATVVPDPVFSTGNLCIGGSDFYPANAFKGALDEIRVWSKELTQADVKQFMHRNIAPNTPQLTAYYKFDDFNIAPVKDYSATAASGSTLGGMNLYNIVASYAPIAGAKYDSLADLGASWWAYNTNVQTGVTLNAGFSSEPKYLLLARNAKGGDTALGIPAGVTRRLNRSWLADKFGAVTESMSFSFNTKQLGAAGLDSAKEYFLLYSGNGINYELVFKSGIMLTDSILSFPNTNVREGWYTLGWRQISYLRAPSNQAYSFNGTTDIVRVPYAKFGAPASDFAIELWARTGAGGSGDDALINANENVSGRKGYYIEYGYSNSATPGLKAGIARTNGNWLTALYSTANWQPDEWHHVVMSYDAAAREIHLFQDGVEVANASMGTDQAVFSTRPFGIGGSDSYTANGFKGALDEVRVWKKQLSAAEINDSMHLQIAANDTMLKAYFKLDSLGTSGVVRNEADTGMNGLAASGMSSKNVIVSYAPVEMQPIAGFSSYKANWSTRNRSYNKGLTIKSGYPGEPAFVIHKTNAAGGVDSSGAVVDRKLNRVWHLSKTGIGNTPLQLEFYADSLLSTRDSLTTVYFLKSTDNVNYGIVDSIAAMRVADTLRFTVQDTLNAYVTLGFRRLRPAPPVPPTPTGVTAGAADDGLSVLPVPTSTELFVSLYSKNAQQAQVAVYNAAGQAMLQSPRALRSGKNTWTINTTSLQPGGYVISIRIDGMTRQTRFVKL